ncbi:unnamed protein product [Adineta ricciae]|uniref:Copper type II ascorbate-dependent monooxygenase C-terminal domain-containing protein n=1 Tax=Adineta ricciae TaxID=249248 RepID=A0A815J7L4_ADIRI|nr:unnamed protein product [Adineta ricciae]
MKKCIGSQLAFLSVVVQTGHGLFSPVTSEMNYTHSMAIPSIQADLWWTVDTNNNSEITFESHMNTTGWIPIGISPDIGFDGSGSVNFQDRFAPAYAVTMLDNTTTNSFTLQSREVNGWTAIQFKRLINIYDYMDVRIKYEILIDCTSTPYSLHFTLCECDSIVTFDNNNLPHGNCDDNTTGGDYLLHGASRESRFTILQLNRAISIILVCDYILLIHFDNMILGDEFTTRCMYSTTNKNAVTLGGRHTDQKMCLHPFINYPRISNLKTRPGIITGIQFSATWTTNSTAQFQTFYSTAARLVAYGCARFYTIMTMASLPTYTDLDMTTCLPHSNSTTAANAIPTSTNTTNSITSNGTTISTSIIITTITANNNSDLVIPQSTLVLFFFWILCAINGLFN